MSDQAEVLPKLDQQDQPKTVAAKKAAPARKSKKPVQPKQSSLSTAALPQLASGGSLITWANDVATYRSYSVSKDGKTWTVVHAQEEAPEHDQVKKIPSYQLKAVLFAALSMLTSVRTDRGYAYISWVSAYQEALKELGSYRIRVHTIKSMLPVVEFTMEEVLAHARLFLPIFERSLKLEAPSKRVGTRVKSAKAEEFELEL